MVVRWAIRKRTIRMVVFYLLLVSGRVRYIIAVLSLAELLSAFVAVPPFRFRFLSVSTHCLLAAHQT